MLKTGAGKRLREARLQKGWSQAQLHRKTGVAEQTISRIENGSPAHDVRDLTIHRLANALGIDKSEILVDQEVAS